MRTAPRPLIDWPSILGAAVAIAAISAMVEPTPDQVSAAAATVAQRDMQAQARRDRAAAQVCDGQPFEWLDGDKVLVCHREIGQARSTSTNHP